MTHLSRLCTLGFQRVGGMGRRKSFFKKIFGVKEKRACADPIDRSAPASIGGEDLDLDLTGAYPTSIGEGSPSNPIESPFFSSPSAPIFVKGFPDKGENSNSSLARMALNNLSSVVPNVSGTQNLRIFVATWNVGGKSPRVDLNLNNLLPTDDQSDIYVLGFQEVVPLNAGNVLVIEDSEPAVKWLGLINKALNAPLKTEGYASKLDPSSCTDNSRQTSGGKSVYRDSKTSSMFFQKRSLKSVSRILKGEHSKRFKTCNCQSEVTRKSCKDSCFRCPQPYSSTNDSSEDEEEEPSSTMTDIPSTNNQLRYCLVTSKQMVGIFVTVWVKREHAQHIGHLRLSTIGRGILGYLGNKGCISVSMSLYQTSFCFVCSHLASGEKEGDELKRNSDVIEILKNTQFPRICKAPNRRIPERILEHDRVIWVGDLNYRIALSYTETRNLLGDNDWDALFEKDQLKIEREAGRVFRGWNEGKIYFAPTYKYSKNSDAYAGETVTSKNKRRTPAWCDRILWHGDGIAQLFYIRGESRFSDHRPVCASFVVEVELPDCRSRSPNMKIGVEELLPQSDTFYSI